jgi:hypothetical protein
MEEPIIIDKQLYPDEAYEPLRKLYVDADSIKQECKSHETCNDCFFYDQDKNYPTCVLMLRTPEDWALDHLS